MEVTQNRFERVAKVLLYILVILLPVWFIPWRFDVEFGREVTFGAIILLAAIFWLLGSLTQSEIRYHRSPFLWAGAALFVIFSLSTIFSKAPMVSALFADPAGERLSTLLLGLLLMILAGSVFRSEYSATKAIFLLLTFGWIAGLLSLLQIFGLSPYQLSIISDKLSFLRGIDFNAIGTINVLALFYTAIFSLGFGILLTGDKRSSAGNLLILIGCLISFFNIVLINFQVAWLVLLAASIILFGFLFRGARPGRGAESFGWRYWSVLALLIFSVVMIMVPTPIFRGPALPTEVSPSLDATLRVAGSFFREGPRAFLLGSGPGTFAIDWARYKDPSINQTIFWGVRFTQGSSWLITLLSTVGILGFLAMLGFLAAACWSFLRKILTLREGEVPLATGVFLGLTSLVLGLLLYPANFSLILLLFLLVGLLSRLLGKGGGTDEKYFSWDITERSIKFTTPTATFISSLAIVFCLSLGVAGLYMVAGRVRAAVAAQAGVAALSRGAVDEAVGSIEQATLLESNNPRYYQMLLQAREEKLRSIIQRAGGGENVGQEFQLVVSLAIQDAQRAIESDPENAGPRRAQGGLYELIIPFINGAGQFAVASYAKAADLEPYNPSIYMEWGRSLLTSADRLQVLAGQANGDNREKIQKERLMTLEEAEKILKKATEAKSDFAPAHFLLAQTALRLGNTSAAIQSVEAAKFSAPFDIGVAFQLGLLYYQNGDLARAEAEFLRAISLNANYSNAHYFLGLIYDRRGQKEKAANEFEKVLAFNPDNEEVQKILANLKKGKNALAGISPPGVAPEKRKETPVK